MEGTTMCLKCFVLFRATYFLKLLLLGMLLLLSGGKCYAEEAHQRIGYELALEREYSIYLSRNSAESSRGGLLSKNEFGSDRIEYVGEAPTVLRMSRIFEYKNRYDADERSVFVVSYRDSVEFLTFSKEADSKAPIPVNSVLSWINRLMSLESDHTLSPNESLQLLLQFLEIERSQSFEPTLVISNWFDLMRINIATYLTIQTDSSSADFTRLQQDIRKLSASLPNDLKSSISEPGVQIEKDTSTISVYLLDNSGTLFHLLVAVSGNTFKLSAITNLGRIGHPAYTF